MWDFESIQAALDEYNAGRLPAIALPPIILGFLTVENVDRIIDSLPIDLREFFIYCARHSYADGLELVSMSRALTKTGAPAPTLPRSEEGLRAIRGWLARHPDEQGHP